MFIYHENDPDVDPLEEWMTREEAQPRPREGLRLRRRGLSRERNGSRSGERRAEPSERRQIGVECDPFNRANAKRGKAPLVL